MRMDPNKIESKQMIEEGLILRDTGPLSAEPADVSTQIGTDIELFDSLNRGLQITLKILVPLFHRSKLREGQEPSGNGMYTFFALQATDDLIDVAIVGECI